jgi:hypothetical protein
MIPDTYSIYVLLLGETVLVLPVVGSLLRLTRSATAISVNISQSNNRKHKNSFSKKNKDAVCI